jgi:methylated-DNA-[protein]-cysteine S-methyltransferase
MNLCFDETTTPLGPLTLVFHGETLCAAIFSDHFAPRVAGIERRMQRRLEGRAAAPAAIAAPFAAYWEGALDALDAITVDPGGTPFQASVWSALRRIPAGQTVSYSTLALAVGRGRGARLSRAVGSANAANPVCIVIPCHRVIRADGSPCGYAGGVERKLRLLAHEGVRAS